MKILSILLFITCAFGQPPEVDSVFVFEDFRGLFSSAIPLVDGGYLVGGWEFEGRNSYRTIWRFNAEREVVWSRGFTSGGIDEYGHICVTDSFILMVAQEIVPIDSNSWTYHDIVVKYSLDGDSLWSREYSDPVNYTAIVSSAPDGQGGYFLLGVEAILSNELYNYEVRLSRIDGNGEELWVRHFGGESSDYGCDIEKLAGDSVLVSALLGVGADSRFAFFWTNLNGDSLGGRIFQQIESTYLLHQPDLIRREGGWDFVWNDEFGGSDGESIVRWIRTDYEGNPEHEVNLSVPQNAAIGFMPSENGLWTTGFSPFGEPNTDVMVGRVSPNGTWHFLERIDLPFYQTAYGFLPDTSGVITLLGRTELNDTTYAPCLFYPHNNEHESFLDSHPAQLHFGVVELGETELRDVVLTITADSAVTVDSLAMPDVAVADLAVPVTLFPGDSVWFQVGFQPQELKKYFDTILVYSDARNAILDIPLTGEAPFPVCSPATTFLNFFWVHMGDSVRRQVPVNNTGTRPLHIETMEQLRYFRLDSLGPFVAAPDSFVTLIIWFKPDSTVLFREFLVLRSDDPQGPDSILLTGRGIGEQTSEDSSPELPREFRLLPPYPNPFNATTTIEFELPRAASVSLELYDVTGRLAREMLRGEFTPGTHTMSVSLPDASSGLYFAVLKALGDTKVQKLLLIR